MPDYSKGKIYKLVSNVSDEIYIGSTVQPLHQRKAGHFKSYKSYLSGKGGYTTSFKLIEKGDVEIILIEECSVHNKMELHRKEREYIEKLVCLNKRIPGRTRKEWGEDNKEKNKQYNKEYRQNNKEKLQQKEKQYYENNKKKINQQKKKYYEKNKEKLIKIAKEYRENNKDKTIQNKKQYYENNKDKVKQYYLDNKEKLNEKAKASISKCE